MRRRLQEAEATKTLVERENDQLVAAYAEPSAALETDASTDSDVIEFAAQDAAAEVAALHGEVTRQQDVIATLERNAAHTAGLSEELRSKDARIARLVAAIDAGGEPGLEDAFTVGVAASGAFADSRIDLELND